MRSFFSVYFFIFLIVFSNADRIVADESELRQNDGMVTMLNFGSQKCLPCRMMIPVINKLKEDYKGKAEILYIDIVADRSTARQYGIRTVPTQIFFNKQGREVYRHVGFLDHEESVVQLDKLGAN